MLNSSLWSQPPSVHCLAVSCLLSTFRTHWVFWPINSCGQARVHQMMQQRAIKCLKFTPSLHWLDWPQLQGRGISLTTDQYSLPSTIAGCSIPGDIFWHVLAWEVALAVLNTYWRLAEPELVQEPVPHIVCPPSGPANGRAEAGAALPGGGAWQLWRSGTVPVFSCLHSQGLESGF